MLEQARDNSLAETPRGNCLSRIRSLARAGRNTAGTISSYVLTNPHAIPRMTLTELAAATSTSIASVSRFCNTMGYENYRAFQIGLAASLAASGSAVLDLFNPDDDASTIIRRVFELKRKGLDDTEALLNHDTLIAVAGCIARARRLFVVGIGASGQVARTAALRLSSLGITATALTDPVEALLNLSSSAPGDVALSISHCGRTATVVEMQRLARRKQAATAVITNYADSPLARESDHVLLTSFRERRVNAAVSSSSIEQLCILEAIYFLIAHFAGPKAEGLIAEIEQAAEDTLRAKQ